MAESGVLLNRQGVKSSLRGSNPRLSAIQQLGANDASISISYSIPTSGSEVSSSDYPLQGL